MCIRYPPCATPSLSMNGGYCFNKSAMHLKAYTSLGRPPYRQVAHSTPHTRKRPHDESVKHKTDRRTVHLQNTCSQTLVMPRHSSIAGALREQSSSSSITELYAVRSSSYLPASPESTMQAMEQCARCVLGSVKEGRSIKSKQVLVGRVG